MEFYKMHGCGNDFCIIEYEPNVEYSTLAKELCDRRFGIGADGLIIVKTNPLEMIFYNQDGSRASMCGNGIRCFARYVYEKRIVTTKQFDCFTLAGMMKIEITSEDPFLCKIDMGKPSFSNSMIHVSDDIKSFGRLLTIEKYSLTIYSFFMGTIHTVIFVDSLDSEVLNFAEKICKNRLFKKQTNVNFVHLIDETHIEIKTYERGVGWTLACGTGACASVVTCARLKLTKNKVSVLLPYGSLKIEITKKENVLMEGPAVLSYIGQVKECLEC
ncbi:MAG: diaminopimelate epimerase [Anaeroplasmataceae bacterium]|nr:diaminopimelate epimerase [Anaeroplasmataceae bacterium]